jgi:NADPH-dependent 2,4-dienoyl-CoA reductase/sulfur reductase-like enzyme
MRFGVEVLSAMKDAVGASLTVGCRLSATDYVSGGLALADTIAYARGLQAAGADYIHVSAGVYASFQYIIPAMDFPPGWLVPMASEVKSSLSIPVIAVSRITDPRLADEIIARGDVDLIAFGRAFLADPQFPNKAREGRLEDIVTCIGVNQGCGGRVAGQLDATCVVNPTTGRELTFGLEPAAQPKNVLVVGGGPAGMEAARVAAERGHHVTLCEQSDRLGGQARLAGELPHRSDWQLYLRDARHRLDKAGVEVLLGTPVTEDWIREKAPKVIVFATGSRMHRREVPGAQPGRLSDVQTVMNAGEPAAGTVLVVGANRIGLGFAEWLAERGASVSLIEPSTSVGGDVEGGTLPVLMERVRTNPRIDIQVDRDVREITAEGLVIGQTGVIGPLFAQVIPNVETIVFADDRRSENYLAQLARARGLADEIYEIGDCETPRSSLEAIYEGASIGRRI